jgi:hypothetical protein
MSKMYYIFSKTKSLEAIYHCDDNEYIENPKLITGVYPIGTLLSNSMRILKSWTKKTSFPMQYPNLENYSSTTSDSSFSNIINDDQCAKTIFNTILGEHDGIVSKKKPEEFRRIFKICMEYVTLRQKDKDFSSVDNLQLFINKANIELPNRVTYNSKRISNSIFSFNFSIDELNSDSSSNEISFEPTLKKNNSKHLFDINDNPSPKKTPFGPLVLPLSVFPICDITDFILASLHCIFEQKRTIGKCPYCGDLFVARDRRRKYCPLQTIGAETKDCYSKEKLERQLKNEQKESSRLDKINRNTFTNKMRFVHQDKVASINSYYLQYLDESQNWRDKIKRKEETEEAYVNWLLEQKEKIRKFLKQY